MTITLVFELFSDISADAVSVFPSPKRSTSQCKVEPSIESALWVSTVPGKVTSIVNSGSGMSNISSIMVISSISMSSSLSGSVMSMLKEMVSPSTTKPPPSMSPTPLGSKLAKSAVKAMPHQPSSVTGVTVAPAGRSMAGSMSASPLWISPQKSKSAPSSMAAMAASLSEYNMVPAMVPLPSASTAISTLIRIQAVAKSDVATNKVKIRRSFMASS